MGLPGHAHHTARGSETTLGDRWTDHPSQRIQVESACAQTVEEVFGWVKTVGGGRKLRYRGVDRNQMWAELTVAGYNLVRLTRLAQSPA